MPSNRALLLLAAAWLVSSAASVRADDWKTIDGKVYQDVKVIQTQPDAVTILHKDGGALVPLANLPPDLQKRFHYDPAKARAAAEARARDDAENAKALQAEMDQASQLRRTGTVSADTGAVATNSLPIDDATDGLASAPAASDPSHHSLADLDAFSHTLKIDSSDATHHSIDDLSATTDTLRRDLDDPSLSHHGPSRLCDAFPVPRSGRSESSLHGRDRELRPLIGGGRRSHHRLPGLAGKICFPRRGKPSFSMGGSYGEPNREQVSRGRRGFRLGLGPRSDARRPSGLPAGLVRRLHLG